MAHGVTAARRILAPSVQVRILVGQRKVDSRHAALAQPVEHRNGNAEVSGSTPLGGSQ